MCRSRVIRQGPRLYAHSAGKPRPMRYAHAVYCSHAQLVDNRYDAAPPNPTSC